ncbi:SDR family NAD(P)-dependent oxidoreductase [Actinomadura nitritigenes]|uniref:SDR family NAD(P)-dependent oxidoreductase n=1 Tax=Actinomadura nitritigenes TaxID=134602 RepID=UPI00368C110C
MLDAHWAVNTRSTILLTQAFAAQHDGRAGGRVVFLTSGQDPGPMRDEVAYAAAKGTLSSVTPHPGRPSRLKRPGSGGGSIP